MEIYLPPWPGSHLRGRLGSDSSGCPQHPTWCPLPSWHGRHGCWIQPNVSCEALRGNLSFFSTSTSAPALHPATLRGAPRSVQPPGAPCRAAGLLTFTSATCLGPSINAAVSHVTLNLFPAVEKGPSCPAVPEGGQSGAQPGRGRWGPIWALPTTCTLTASNG